MDEERETRYQKLEVSVHEIKNDVHEIKTALLGNNLSGEKGLTGRMNSIDLRQTEIEKKMDTLFQERFRNAFLMKIATFLLGTIAVGLLGLFFEYLKKPK